MSNLLKAITNLVNNPVVEITDYYSGRNRANSVGSALEVYIKDIFANTVSETNEQNCLTKYEEVFSYLGNQNNPPDMILKGGDAIEVKKIQSGGSALALNSSFPKSKLYANSPMITAACRNCEEWESKDIIYAVGYTSDNAVNWLWLVYGDCYAADQEIYNRIKTTISEGIETIPNVEFTETKELGKVKKVDPLGITDLRIRGMWHIDNPNKVFNYIDITDDCNFKLRVLMKKDKYLSFPESDRSVIENNDLINVSNIRIKNPNNPANLMDAVFIQFTID